MNVTYKQRQELNKLSKELYGNPSKWASIYHKGIKLLKSKKPAGRKGRFIKESELVFLTIDRIQDLMLNKLQERKDAATKSDT